MKPDIRPDTGYQKRPDIPYNPTWNDFIAPCVKVWDLEKESSKSLLRMSRLSIPGSPSEPVTIAVNENLQLLAVGYQNGAVSLYRGDATKAGGDYCSVFPTKGG